MEGSGPPITDAGVRCIRCGYNLSGAALGGYCPECGMAVAPSLNQGGGGSASGKAIAALVLGICSIVGCMLYAIPGLVCGVLALNYSAKVRDEEYGSPQNASSQGMAKAGRICGIIGLCLSSLYALIIAVYIVIFIALVSSH